MGCRVLESNDYRITCSYASHQARIKGKNHIFGVDITTAAATTCAITAHSDGVVRRAINYISGHEMDRQGYGFGNQIIIEHRNGICTIYSHLAPGTVNASEWLNVKAGQVIAYMGNTGTSTGAHLDFSCIRLKPGYNVSDIDLVKDVDIKFNALDPELYLDADLPAAQPEAEAAVYNRVQAGSFSNPEYALRRFDLLKVKGYPVIIKYHDGHYRTQVGAYTDYNNALKTKARLDADGIDCYITTEAGTDIDVESIRALIS